MSKDFSPMSNPLLGDDAIDYHTVYDTDEASLLHSEPAATWDTKARPVWSKARLNQISVRQREVLHVELFERKGGGHLTRSGLGEAACGSSEPFLAMFDEVA